MPGVCPEPYWDYTIGNDYSKTRSLLKKAHTTPLTTSQVELIKRALDHDNELVLHYCFHPNKLSGVI